MYRWDIINHLIRENNYKSYLEIGYYKGWSFDRIECERKTAVDPNPCKYPEWESYQGEGMFVENGGVIVKQTSDKFFETRAIAAPDEKYDIIFIDGLHESQQVDRDIQNALKHLSPGGVIVMHDCNPSSYDMTTKGTPLGEWTGDVYKSFIRLRSQSQYRMYVIDTDYGVGIIDPAHDCTPGTNLMIRNLEENGIYDNFEYFQENKKKALNLIPADSWKGLLEGQDIKDKINEQTATIHNLPA